MIFYTPKDEYGFVHAVVEKEFKLPWGTERKLAILRAVDHDWANQRYEGETVKPR